jgi:hypothetical protein
MRRRAGIKLYDWGQRPRSRVTGNLPCEFHFTGCVDRLSRQALPVKWIPAKDLSGYPTIGTRGRLCGLDSGKFLGESDEKPFRPADVAESIGVFIPDDIAYELRAALAEPFKRLVDVVHREHDAEVA